MREFEKCLEMKRDIDDIDEEIIDLKARVSAPKNQVITGMPGCASTDNAIERYLTKLEKLEAKKKYIREQQKKKWENAVLKLGDIGEERKMLLYYRFLCGLSWKKCAAKMDHDYGGWNINRVFRAYRKIAKKY